MRSGKALDQTSNRSHVADARNQARERQVQGLARTHLRRSVPTSRSLVYGRTLSTAYGRLRSRLLLQSGRAVSVAASPHGFRETHRQSPPSASRQTYGDLQTDGPSPQIFSAQFRFPDGHKRSTDAIERRCAGLACPAITWGWAPRHREECEL